MSNFCVKNSIEGEDGKEDFLEEDTVDIKLVFQWSLEPVWKWNRSTLDHSQWISCAFSSQVEL